VRVTSSVAAVAVYVSFEPPPDTPHPSSSTSCAPVVTLCSVTTLSLLKKHESTAIVCPTQIVVLHGCCATVFENGPHAYAELMGGGGGGGRSALGGVGLGGGGGLGCFMGGGGGVFDVHVGPVIKY
jgi:hypothetical protein